MFESVIVRVSNLDVSRRFYETVLGAIGIGPEGWREFRLEPTDAAHPDATSGLHIAFVTRWQEQVDRFWRTGIEAGYPSDGEPGPRPIYSPDYYGGFLRDDNRSFAIVRDERPVTHNLELVFPATETARRLDVLLPHGLRIRTR